MTHRYVTEGPGVSQTPGGAYSAAVVSGAFCHLSGQLPVDAATGEFVGGSIADQLRAALGNMLAALTAAGFDQADLVSVVVLLDDVTDWDAMNETYREVMGDGPLPARIAFGADVPHGAKVEVQGVAHRPEASRP